MKSFVNIPACEIMQGERFQTKAQCLLDRYTITTMAVSSCTGSLRRSLKKNDRITESQVETKPLCGASAVCVLFPLVTWVPYHGDPIFYTSIGDGQTISGLNIERVSPRTPDGSTQAKGYR
jgi:hypothetical protein